MIADSLNKTSTNLSDSLVPASRQGTEAQIEYRTTLYRFVVLFFVFFYSVSLSSCSVALSAAADNIADAYGVSTFAVVMCPILYTLMYIPGTFIAIYLFKEWRPSPVFRLVALTGIIGVWLRQVAALNQQFMWILAGYTLMALAYPCMLTSLTMVCNIWCGDKERTFFIQFMSLSVPVGTITAFASSAIAFSGKNIDYILATERLIFLENCVVSVFALGLLVFVRDKPEHPPSVVAVKKEDRPPICQLMGEVYRDRNYLWLSCIYGMLYGAFVSLPIELAPIFSFYVEADGVTPLYSDTVVAIYGMAVSILGIFSSVIAAVLLQKYQRFSLSLKLICGTTFVCGISSMITIPIGNIWITGITIIILGIGLVPISPVGMNFASELTFPTPAASTNGLLLMVGHAAGCVIALVGTPLCSINPEVLLGFYVGMAFISFILSFWVKEDLKKLAFVRDNELNDYRCSKAELDELQ